LSLKGNVGLQAIAQLKRESRGRLALRVKVRRLSAVAVWAVAAAARQAVPSTISVAQRQLTNEMFHIIVLLHAQIAISKRRVFLPVRPGMSNALIVCS
jgi:hypothetical protein